MYWCSFKCYSLMFLVKILQEGPYDSSSGTTPSRLFSCLVSSPDPTLTRRHAWGRHETTSCLPDIMHVIPSSRPSHSCILQSIKNWRREQPGNKPSHCLWLLPNKAPLRRIASYIRHMQLATHTQTHTHTHTHTQFCARACAIHMHVPISIWVNNLW